MILNQPHEQWRALCIYSCLLKNSHIVLGIRVWVRVNCDIFLQTNNIQAELFVCLGLQQELSF